MNRRISTLNKTQTANVKRLRDAFKEDPYSARILYMSNNFARNCTTERLMVEHRVDAEENILPDYFKVYLKTTYHQVTQDLELKEESYKFKVAGYKNGRFFKYSDSHPQTQDFQMVGNDEVGMEVTSSSKSYHGAHRSSDGELRIGDIISTENLGYIYAWMNHFPWMAFMIEHCILINEPFNSIKEQGITTLRKAMIHEYNIPFPTCKAVHEAVRIEHYAYWERFDEMDDAEGVVYETPVEKVMRYLALKKHDSIRLEDKKRETMVYPHHNFFPLYDRVLSNRENFQTSWLFGQGEKQEHVVWNVLRYAVLMDKTVDCKWSHKKILDMNSRWTREYAYLIHKHDNRELLVATVFQKFSERFEIPYIKDVVGLKYEGMRMKHCVGGYEHQVSTGNCCIYQFEGNTLQLNWGGFPDDTGISRFKRNSGLSLGMFYHYANTDVPYELRKKVNDMVIEFNRWLLTIPLEEYLELKNEAVHGYERFHSTYPDMVDGLDEVPMEADADDRPRLRAIGDIPDRIAQRYANRPVNPAYYGRIRVDGDDAADDLARHIDREIVHTITTLADAETFEEVGRIGELIGYDEEAPANRHATRFYAINDEGQRLDVTEQMYGEDTTFIGYNVPAQDVMRSAIIDGHLDEGAEAVLLDPERNLELLGQMEQHFGEMDEGDVISAEGLDGTHINMIVRDGRLETYVINDVTDMVNNNAQLREWIDEAQTVGELAMPEGREVYPDQTEGYGHEEKCKEEPYDFLRLLRKVLLHHAEEASKRGISVNETYEPEAVREMFSELCTFMLAVGGVRKTALFVHQQFDLITRAVDSINVVPEGLMNEIMANVEKRIEMHKNPYYDLIEVLAAEG